MASPRRHHQHVADEHAATPIHKSTTHTDPTCNCLPHCNCLLAAAAPRAGTGAARARACWHRCADSLGSTLGLCTLQLRSEIGRHSSLETADSRDTRAAGPPAALVALFYLDLSPAAR